MSESRPVWRQASAVYLDRRIIAILFLGFSSGLPLVLTGSTLSIWLEESDFSKTAIGLFSLVGLPYTIKFCWAPLMDRVRLPWLGNRFGRRRGWALATQAMLMVGIFGLGQSDPEESLWMVAVWALFVSFASASQDIVIDAYRVELLDERQYGAGAAMVVGGYRVGTLVAGAGVLYLADAVPWSLAYAVMAVLVIVGSVTILLNREPKPTLRPRHEARVMDWISRRAHLTGWRRETATWAYGAVLAPFADFMLRRWWLAILIFILLYKIGDSMASLMAGPFYLDLGFSKTEIASISKIFGFGATLGGAAIGGILVARYGIMWSLMACGILQMLSNLMFAAQAVVGADLAFLTLTIGLENAAGGMGTAAFVAYLSVLCNAAYTATQYALLSSLFAVARVVLPSVGGVVVDLTNWVTFFVLTTIAALPGLLILWWLMRRGHDPRIEALMKQE